MPTELRWLSSVPASALYAAHQMLRGRELVDAELAEAINNPVKDLSATMEATGVPAERFLGHLSGLAVLLDGNRDLAESALAKTIGRGRAEPLVERFAGLLGDLKWAFLQARPNAAQELALRAEPLRLQWEARGPGLLHCLARLTEESFLVPRADVVLLQPVLGGGGAAHVLYNAVGIEAVLANPIAELPEVLRLGWLLSHLNLDLPKYQGQLTSDRTMQVGALALVPAVLAAGEEVELARLDEPRIANAITAWGAGPADAGLLAQWWETYVSSRPSWEVALAALDCMLS